MALIFFVKSGFSALSAPVLQCIALDEAGNVTLTWSQPQDPNSEFSQYIIYYQDGEVGSFNSIEQINSYDTLTTTILGNFSGIGSFYIVVTSNGGIEVSPSSNVVSPLLISLSNSNRQIIVKFGEFNLPSTDSIFQIYRRIDLGPFVWIGQTKRPNQQFVDTLKECKANVQYYVEIEGIGGCESRSNFPVEAILDKTPPLQTNLICASVDTSSGTVNLSWEQSRSFDSYGYIIYFFEGFIRTDTVFGANNLNTSYITDGINALIRSETLSVAPFDSCLDLTSGWYNQAADSLRLRTLFIDTFGYDRCAGKIGIKWNIPTDSFPVGVKDLSGFRVYRQTNNGVSIKIGTLSDLDSVFVDSTLVKGDRYTYVVSAFDSKRNKEALSNKMLFEVTAAREPQQFYITHIQADPESQNNLVFLLTDSTSETVRYGLQRAFSKDDEFQNAAFSDVINENAFYIEDESGRADQTDFYYRIAAFDYCDDLIKMTPVAKSMYIDGFKQEADYVNFLEWSGYEGFDALGSSVSSYYLIRQTNDTKQDTIYESLKIFDATDTIFDLTYIGGKICYFVKALESSGDRYGLVNTSISNQFCVTYNPLVYIPNAFTPEGDGINDVFLPDVNFVDVSNYALYIYDRSGLLVFKTNNPQEGWDGLSRDIGLYVYQLELKNAHGESTTFNGKVLLLR
jgi:gliding motility-associated-like protein